MIHEYTLICFFNASDLTKVVKHCFKGVVRRTLLPDSWSYFFEDSTFGYGCRCDCHKYWLQHPITWPRQYDYKNKRNANHIQHIREHGDSHGAGSNVLITGLVDSFDRVRPLKLPPVTISQRSARRLWEEFVWANERSLCRRWEFWGPLSHIHTQQHGLTS